MNRRHSVRDPGGLTERGVKEFRVSWFLQLKEGLECRGIAPRSQFLALPCFPRANPRLSNFCATRIGPQIPKALSGWMIKELHSGIPRMQWDIKRKCSLGWAQPDQYPLKTRG